MGYAAEWSYDVLDIQAPASHSHQLHGIGVLFSVAVRVFLLRVMAHMGCAVLGPALIAQDTYVYICLAQVVKVYHLVKHIGSAQIGDIE